MTLNPHVKSCALLAASIAGAAVFSFFCGWLIFATSTGAEQAEAIEYGLLMGLTISPFFGFLFWAMTFEPPVIPPVKTVGWRRFRFLIWWAGIAAFLMAAQVVRHGVNGASLVSLASVSVPLAAMLTFAGWVFLSARADRARTLDKQRRRKAFAGRLTEAILEVAKSDPYLTVAEISAFLSKPYNAMHWLGEHGWVRPADLSYFSGVADAVVIPETVDLGEDKTVPVLPEYVVFVQALKALATGDWADEAMERIVAHMEQRAAELRRSRLDKKL